MKKIQQPLTNIGKNTRDSVFILIAPALIAFLEEFARIDFGNDATLISALISVLLVILNRYTR